MLRTSRLLIPFVHNDFKVLTFEGIEAWSANPRVREGARRSVDLALRRMADDLPLLVKRAQDHLPAQEMAAHGAQA